MESRLYVGRDLVRKGDFCAKVCGYTSSMKTAISIPDDVFQEAERLARRTKKSRSQLFSDAVREYVARHAPDEITDAMNRVCADLGDSRDQFISAAGRRIVERSEW
jgi:metal-responsive CopG/Arc/MetJ family transcriptional regulator